ncbi:Membrane-associated progesterone-binding protein 4 [Zea mays]|uniref:Membrane-associated progesterone-binding protein 4 n=1 Tax=Zea mays TaxID=4577 RepID=A0A3L6D9S0_MAIZE|nr:Membrane-associated progesterone-binding protein 4 [Zea mays]
MHVAIFLHMMFASPSSAQGPSSITLFLKVWATSPLSFHHFVLVTLLCLFRCKRILKRKSATTSLCWVTTHSPGDGLTDSLQGLSSSEVNSIVDWRKFYFERYIFAGKLIGHYYDSQGNPTKYLKGVEMKAKRGAQLLEKQKSDEAKIPGCNSKWSQQEGGEVWCDTGYPRLVRRPGDIALTGQVSQRCACFQENELDKAGLVVYEGCDYLSQSCKVN